MAKSSAQDLGERLAKIAGSLRRRSHLSATCATLRRMSADASSTRRNVPVLVALLFGANAATQFAIQAWLAYGFADHVWGLAQPLPWAVPLALDLFAINLMAFAY